MGDLFDEVEAGGGAPVGGGAAGSVGGGLAPGLGGSSPSTGGAGPGGAPVGTGAQPFAGSGSSEAGTGGAAGSAGGAASEGGGGSEMGEGGSVAPIDPPCDPCPCNSGAFGEPEPVAGLGLAVESFGGPAPSADGLTLYFSAIEAVESIFFATRATRGNQFAGAQLLPGVNDPLAADGTPFVSADDRSIFFFSTRADPAAPGERDLWVATRSGPGEAFSAPSLVPGVNTGELEHLPRLTPDGLSLMFVSGRPSENLHSNIWQSSRATLSSAFSIPVELPGVNSDTRDEGFWLSADGLTLLFASNRVPEANMDIWVATRGDVGESFGEAQNLEVVNTDGIEIDPALTLDGFELFFASDRSGTMQLYRSARLCE